LARLVVTVRDASTGAALPYTHVEADGVVLTAGLDGAAVFEVALGATKTIKVRHTAFRPWSRSVTIMAERVEVPADLEKALL